MKTQYEEIYRTARKNLVNHFRIFLSSNEEYVKPADFHYTISEILLNKKGHFAIEAFRESAKTSMVLLDFPIYCLQFPRKDRSYIVIIKQNQSLAESKLKEIALSYISNPLLGINLKEVKQQSAKIFECVVHDESGKEITMRLEAYGKGGTLRGLNFQSRRPDIVIMDDPQDFEDSRSQTTMERDWEWFLSDVKPLGKATRIFIIGNNLGEKCLIEKIFKERETMGFEMMRIPAMVDGKSTWPQQFSERFLEDEKVSYQKAGKLEIWYRERMCESIAGENQDFKREYFKYYEEQPEIKSVVMAVDLAISEKQTADYTAISVLGSTNENKIYILDYVRDRMPPDKIIDSIFTLASKWKPHEVVIETNQYQKMLAMEVEKQMPVRNIFFPLNKINSTGDKITRIRSSLQPRFAAGNIYHKLSHAELEDELLIFPKGSHDDLIDSVSMATTAIYNRWNNAEKKSYAKIPSLTGDADLDKLFKNQKSSKIISYAK